MKLKRNAIAANPFGIAELIKRDFEKLWRFKLRGESLEVVTPFSTVTNKFVSVFITIRNGKYVVTDGAMISDGMNEYGINQENLQVAYKAAELFNIKTTYQKGLYFYKISEAKMLLSSDLHDMASFIAIAVNTTAINNPTNPTPTTRNRL